MPDAIQGSTSPVAAFLTTVPKIGALAALLRLGETVLADGDVPWAALVSVIAAASMTLGDLAAFFQTDVKRLLAYSTISQVGYLLLPVAVADRSDPARPALLYYLAAYAVTNLGAFAVVCALPRATRIDDYRGLARRRPLLAASLVVCLLGLVGTPPTAVFVGKLEAFSAAFDGGHAWLAVLAAVNTVASLFPYLRWILPAASGRPGDQLADGDLPERGVAYTAAGVAEHLAQELGVGVGELVGEAGGDGLAVGPTVQDRTHPAGGEPGPAGRQGAVGLLGQRGDLRLPGAIGPPGCLSARVRVHGVCRSPDHLLQSLAMEFRRARRAARRAGAGRRPHARPRTRNPTPPQTGP